LYIVLTNTHNTMEKLKNQIDLIEELREQAQELIDFGDSHEKREGYCMMKVINAIHLITTTSESYDTDSPWVDIRNNFQDGDIIYIDAWTTESDDEGGKVIAKVNVQTKEVEYLDERAKTDSYAQTSIQEVLNDIN